MGINRGINPWHSSLPYPDLVPQFRGDWVSVNYETADIVQYSNSLYIALYDTDSSDIPGISNKWQTIVSGSQLPVTLADLENSRRRIEESHTTMTNSFNTIAAEANTLKQELSATADDVRRSVGVFSLGRYPVEGDPAGVYRVAGKEITWNGSTVINESLVSQSGVSLAYKTFDELKWSTAQDRRVYAEGRLGGFFSLLPINDPTPTDDIRVITRIDGRKLKREAPENYYEAHWFNIAGDGVQDDQVGLQWLANYACEHGGIYNFSPHSKIKVSTNVEFHNNSKPIILRGNGTTIIGQNVNKSVIYSINCNSLQIDGFTTTHEGVGDEISKGNSPTMEPRRTPGGHGQCHYFSKDIQITNCKVINISSMGILMVSVNGYSIIGNYIHNTMGDGIHSAFSCKNGVIANNVVQFTGDDGIPVVSYKSNDPLYIESAKNIAITGNVIYRTAARGLVVDGGDAITFTGNTVELTSGCGIFVNSGGGFNTKPSTKLIFNGNIIRDAGRNPSEPIDNAAGVGIYSDDFSTHEILISNNHIINPKFSGVDLHKVSGIKIFGNIIEEVQSNCITIYNVRDIVVDNNTVSNSINNGIYVSNSSQVDLLNNRVTKTNEHGIGIIATTDSIIAGNILRDVGRLNNASGIVIAQATTNSKVTDNIVVRNAAINWSIIVEESCSGIVIKDNDVSGGGDRALLVPVASGIRVGNVGAKYPITAVTIPASGVVLTNPFNTTVLVTIQSGNVTKVTVNGTPLDITGGSFVLNAGDTIALEYTAPPKWAWTVIN